MNLFQRHARTDLVPSAIAIGSFVKNYSTFVAHANHICCTILAPISFEYAGKLLSSMMTFLHILEVLRGNDKMLKKSRAVKTCCNNPMYAWWICSASSPSYETTTIRMWLLSPIGIVVCCIPNKRFSIYSMTLDKCPSLDGSFR